MSETDSSERLGEAFQRLGENLERLIRHAWASGTRRQLQTDLETGLRQLEQSVRDLAQRASESDTGQQIQQDLSELQQKVETGELGSQARRELLHALDRLNSEIEAALADWPGEEATGGSEEEPDD
jgi:hypothetical protein